MIGRGSVAGWVTPEGDFHPMGDAFSHIDWANKNTHLVPDALKSPLPPGVDHGMQTCKNLLKAGWVQKSSHTSYTISDHSRLPLLFSHVARHHPNVREVKVWDCSAKGKNQIQTHRVVTGEKVNEFGLPPERAKKSIVRKATRADYLLKEALREERRLSCGERSRVDRLIARALGEAVDAPEHAESVLLNYHYIPDPRDHNGHQDGDRWFVHEDGHQVFVVPDPTVGFIWHHYQANPKKAVVSSEKEPRDFRKGSGIEALDSLLGQLHTNGSI